VKSVTRNYAEKSINNTLDFVSNSPDMGFLEKFYATTLDSLQEQKNDVGSERPCSNLIS
jgi:COP9 signalosome complex subunit 2